jgi:hypothetical protein
MHSLDSGCILWTVDEIFGKWINTAVNSEADENNSMSDGVARRSDQGGPRYPLGEQGRRTPGRVPNEGWMGPTEADRCSTEGARVPDGEREWPNRGRDGCPTKGWSRGVAQRRVSRVAQRRTI